LHVRGGSASQTLVRLDGTTVYKPTHFFGFFSMFNPDAIGTVTLHKGPYPAEYGGRLGSVIDVQSRSGNRDRTGGGVTLSLTASRAYLNGPIGDQSAPTGSYLVAARRSTFDPVLSVLQNVDTEGIPNGLAFYDANVHLTVSPSPSDELSLVLYGARDALDLHLHEDGVQFDIRYENQGLNATWAHRFGPNLSASASLLGSRYHNTPVVDAWGTHFEEENGLAEGAFDAHFRYAGPDAHTLTGGLRTSGVRFQLHNSETREDRSLKVGWDRTASGVTTEAYVQDTYRPTRRWEIRGGLRGTYYQRGNFKRLAPRLSVAYRPTRSIRLQTAYSRTHQFRTPDKDSRLPGFDTWVVADEGVPPASGHQVSTGTTIQAGEHWEIETAGYYRVMNDLFELRPFLTSYELAALPHAERFWFGEGRAYGGELYLQRRDALEVELAANWHLSETWTLTGRLNYRTGRPYTPGYEDPILGSPFPSQSRRVPRQINTARLPAYHRLDLGVEKTGNAFEGADYKLTAKVMNVYARKNVWLRNFERRDDERIRDYIYQFPVPIPYVTFSLHF
jgi:hypothetical protein